MNKKRINAELLNILACPECGHHPLIYHPQELEFKGEDLLQCSFCRRSYPVINDIPDLRPAYNAISGEVSKKWRKWKKKLDNFLAWRETRRQSCIKACLSQGRDLHRKMAQLSGLYSIVGHVLDVGCGSGMTRDFLAKESIYIGLDPAPIPGTEKLFPIVRGVGEKLPFRTGIFSAAITMGTLPHVIDPQNVVFEMARVSSPGAILAIEVPVIHPPSPALKSRIRRASDAFFSIVSGKPNSKDPRMYCEWSCEIVRTLLKQVADILHLEKYHDQFIIAIGRVRTISG